MNKSARACLTVKTVAVPFSCAFPREKAPHSSGGIKVLRMHEKQKKCCIGGSSELLARLFFVPQSMLATVRHLQGKIQGFTPLEQG